MKWIIIFLLSANIFARDVASVPESVSDYSPIYQVKEGDTLSEIAQKKLGGDIYAPGGSLEQLIALNPKLKRNHIYPGQKLVLADPAVKLPKNLEVIVKTKK